MVSELADNRAVTASINSTIVPHPIAESLEQLNNHLTPTQLGESLYKSYWQITPNLGVNSGSHSSLLSDSEAPKQKVKAAPLLHTALGFGATTSLLAVTGTAYALSGPQVVSGNVNLVKNGSVTTITNSPNAIINWQSFNIGKNEIVKFIQQSANSAVLNRVLGKQASEILGSLESNGRVFLINPNGILFGKNATVNVAELVASTLYLSDEDFKQNRLNFTQDKDSQIATILNQGMIKVQEDGTLALIGGNVLNNGVLEARNGSIYLLAGKSITIADLDNPLISYKVAADNRAVNLGQIISKRVNILGGKVAHGKTDTFSYADLFTAANTTENDLDIKITATGEVELYAGSYANKKQTSKQSHAEVIGEKEGLLVANATITTANVKGKAGSVRLLGDAINVQGKSKILATGLQGGEVAIGSGIYTNKEARKNSTVTVFGNGQVVDVSATKEAGSITLWGDRAYFDGNLLANSEASKGGFIETSGRGLKLAESLVISTKSNLGDAYYGNWLLDPNNVYIYHKGESYAAGYKETDNSFTPSGDFRSFADTEDVYISDETVSKYLENSSIKLDAVSNIYFQKGVDITHSSANKTLVVKAPNISVLNSHLRSNNFSFEATTLQVVDSCITSVGFKQTNFFASKSASFSNTTIISGGVSFDGCNTGGYSLDKTIVASKGNIYGVNVTTICITNSSNLQAIPGDIAKREFGDIEIIAKESVTTDYSYIKPFRLFNATAASGKVNIINGTYVDARLIQINGPAVEIEGALLDSNYTNAKNPLQINASNGQLVITDSTINNLEEIRLLANTGTGENGKIKLTNSVINSGCSSVRAEAKTSLETSGSNITTFSNVYFRGPTLTISNSNVTSLDTNGNRELSIGNNSTTKIESSNVNYTTKGPGDVNLHGSANVNTTGDKVVSGRDLNISSPNGIVKIERLDACVSRSINITSKEISLTSSCLTASTSIHAEANNNGEGTITLTGTNFSSPGSSEAGSGTIAFKAAKNLTSSHSNVSGKNNVSVDSNQICFTDTLICTSANIDFNASDTISINRGGVNSSAGNVTVNGTNAVEITYSNFTGHNLTLCSSAASITTENTSYNASQGKFKADGKQGVTLENGTKISGSEGVDITSSSGSLAANGTNISSADGDINLKVHGEISSDNSNLSAANIVLCTTQGCITVNCLTAKASGEVNFTTSGTDGNIQLIGSKLSGENVDITTEGTAEINASYIDTLENSGAINVSGKNGVTLGNGTNISASTSISITADNGSIISHGTNITSHEDDVNLKARDTISLTNTNISGNEIVVVSANSGVTVGKSAFAANNNVSFVGKEAVSISDSNITATGLVNLTSTESTVTIGNSRLDSIEEEAIISGDKGIILNNGTNITAYNDINLSANNGGITTHGTNITSNEGNARLTAKEAISLTNTNISSHSNIVISSQQKGVTVAKSTLTSAESEVTVTGKEELNISDSNITASDQINLTSTESTLTLGNSKVESENENVIVSGDKGVTLNNGSNISGYYDICISAEHGPITTDGTNITSAEGDVNIKANGVINLNNTNISGNEIVVVSAENGVTVGKSSFDAINNVTIEGQEAVSITDSNITAINKVNITSTDLTVSLGNSRLDSIEEDVIISGDKGITLTNGTNISANTDVSLTAAKGPISATGSNITAETGNVALQAQDDITIVNTNISGLDLKLNSDKKGLILTDSSLSATNNISVTGKEEVSITGSQLNATGNVSVDSTDGTITINKSRVNAENGTANISANNGISLGNGTNISAKQDININSNGSINAVGTNITSQVGDVDLKAKENIVITNTNISGKDIKINADGSVTADKSKLTATNNVTVKAINNIDFNNSEAKGNNLFVNSTNGITSINNSSLESLSGVVDLNGNNGVFIGNGTNVTAKTEVKVNSPNGNITVIGSNLTASANVTLNAKEDVSITNSNISGKNISIIAEEGNANIGNSRLNATEGVVDINGYNGVNIGNGTNITAKTYVNITSPNGAIGVTGSNITAGENVSIVAKTDVNIVNSNISGKNISLNATEGNANVNNSRLTALEGDVEVIGDKGVYLGNGTNITAEVDVKLESANGSVKVTGSNVTAGNNVSLVAKEDIVVNNSNISGKNISLTAEKTATVNNSRLNATEGNVEVVGNNGVFLGNGTNITAKVDVKLESENGSVKVTGSNVTAGNNVSLVAKKDIVVNNSNISGKNITLNAENKTEINKSRLNATDGGVNIVGDKEIYIGNGTNISAKTDIDVSSPNGSISIIGSNITTPSNVNIQAKEKITQINSNISGKTIELVSKTQEVTLSSFVGEAVSLKPSERGIFDLNNFTAKDKLEFIGGDLKITNNKGNSPDIIRLGEPLYEHNNSWNDNYKEVPLEPTEPVSPPTPTDNTNQETKVISNPTTVENEEVTRDLPNVTVTTRVTIRDASRDITLSSTPESERTRRDLSSIIAVGSEGEIVTPEHSESTPVINRGDTTNSTSVVDTVNAVDATSTPVIRTSLTTCPVTLNDLYEKYLITTADRTNLTAEENIKKYNISPPDAEQFRRLCIDKLDPLKIPKKKGKS